MIDYLEINDQKHMMCAEGSADDEPTKTIVAQAIRERGFIASNISITHDGLQQMWRFTARIVEI